MQWLITGITIYFYVKSSLFINQVDCHIAGWLLKVRKTKRTVITNTFYFPYLHKGSIVIEKKSLSEISSEFHVSDYADYEK